jgi:hypothetical protein
MAGRIAVGVLTALMAAWLLFGLLWSASAGAQTLPMSQIRHAITDAVTGQLGAPMRVQLMACQRIDAHAGQCVVRVYAPGKRGNHLPVWCGVGYARQVGSGLQAHGMLRSCPGVAPGPVMGGGPAA